MNNNDGVIGLAVRTAGDAQRDSALRLTQNIFSELTESGIASRLVVASYELRQLHWEREQLRKQARIGELPEVWGASESTADPIRIKQRGRELVRTQEYERYLDLQSTKKELEKERDIWKGELNKELLEALAKFDLNLKRASLISASWSNLPKEKQIEEGSEQKWREKISDNLELLGELLRRFDRETRPDLTDLFMKNSDTGIRFLLRLNDDKPYSAADRAKALMATIARNSSNIETINEVILHTKNKELQGLSGETLGRALAEILAPIAQARESVMAMDAVADQLIANSQRMRAKRREFSLLAEETRLRMFDILRRQGYGLQIFDVSAYPFVGRDARNSLESNRKRSRTLLSFADAEGVVAGYQLQGGDKAVNGMAEWANRDLLISASLRDSAGITGMRLHVFPNGGNGTNSFGESAMIESSKKREKVVEGVRATLWKVVEVASLPISKLLSPVLPLKKAEELIAVLQEFYEEHGRLPSKHELEKIGEAYEAAAEISRLNPKKMGSVKKVIRCFGTVSIMLSQDVITEREAEEYANKVPVAGRFLRGLLSLNFAKKRIGGKYYFVRKDTNLSAGQG